MPSSDSSYPSFPIFSMIGFILVLIPLRWHFQAWNAGTCLYMIWVGLACLNLFVNSIVWHGNALNPSPIWCDISVRIIVGVSVAIPAASLCINRRLYKIATAQTMSVNRAQKRRAVIEDLCIGLGIPVIEMALLYVVQGHRFNIFEDIGCYPAIFNTWVSYLLVSTWPILTGLVSAVYCILSLRAFHRRQKQFKEFIAMNSSLTIHRYFRLMALATVELFCTTPFAAYSIYLNLTTETLAPWKGWADAHFNYSRVEQIPATLWRLNRQTVISLELTRWLVVACALLFFAFFGFAEEARRHYREAFEGIVKRLGIRNARFRFWRKSKPSLLPLHLDGKTTGAIPVFIARPKATIPRDSLSPSDASHSNEKLDSSTRFSSSTTLTLPKTESSFTESYGHAY